MFIHIKATDVYDDPYPMEEYINLDKIITFENHQAFFKIKFIDGMKLSITIEAMERIKPEIKVVERIPSPEVNVREVV